MRSPGVRLIDASGCLTAPVERRFAGERTLPRESATYFAQSTCTLKIRSPATSEPPFERHPTTFPLMINDRL